MDQLQPQMPLTQGPVSQPPVTNPPDKSPLAPFSMGKPKGKSKLLFAIIGIVAVLGIGIYIFVGNSSLFTGKLVVVRPAGDLIDSKIDTVARIGGVPNEFEQACTANCGTWDAAGTGVCTAGGNPYNVKSGLDNYINTLRRGADAFGQVCTQASGEWDAGTAPCKAKCTYHGNVYTRRVELENAITGERHASHMPFEILCENKNGQWNDIDSLCVLSGTTYNSQATLETALNNNLESNRTAFRTACEGASGRFTTGDDYHDTCTHSTGAYSTLGALQTALTASGSAPAAGEMTAEELTQFQAKCKSQDGAVSADGKTCKYRGTNYTKKADLDAAINTEDAFKTACRSASGNWLKGSADGPAICAFNNTPYRDKAALDTAVAAAAAQASSADNEFETACKAAPGSGRFTASTGSIPASCRFEGVNYLRKADLDLALNTRIEFKLLCLSSTDNTGKKGEWQEPMSPVENKAGCKFQGKSYTSKQELAVAVATAGAIDTNADFKKLCEDNKGVMDAAGQKCTYQNTAYGSKAELQAAIDLKTSPLSVLCTANGGGMSNGSAGLICKYPAVSGQQYTTVETLQAAIVTTFKNACASGGAWDENKKICRFAGLEIKDLAELNSIKNKIAALKAACTSNSGTYTQAISTATALCVYPAAGGQQYTTLAELQAAIDAAKVAEPGDAMRTLCTANGGSISVASSKIMPACVYKDTTYTDIAKLQAAIDAASAASCAGKNLNACNNASAFCKWDNSTDEEGFCVSKNAPVAVAPSDPLKTLCTANGGSTLTSTSVQTICTYPASGGQTYRTVAELQAAIDAVKAQFETACKNAKVNGTWDGAGSGACTWKGTKYITQADLTKATAKVVVIEAKPRFSPEEQAKMETIFNAMTANVAAAEAAAVAAEELAKTSNDPAVKANAVAARQKADEAKKILEDLARNNVSTIAELEAVAQKIADAKNSAVAAKASSDKVIADAAAAGELTEEESNAIVAAAVEDAADSGDAALQAQINALSQQLAAAQSQNNQAQSGALLTQILAAQNRGAATTQCSDPSFTFDSTRNICVPPTEVVVVPKKTTTKKPSTGASGAQIASNDTSSSQNESAQPTNGTGSTGGSTSGSTTGSGTGNWSNTGTSSSSFGTRESANDIASSGNVAAGTTGASAKQMYGSAIQGATGPEMLLYPILVAGANGLYYLAKRRRKNKLSR
ncbi:MAG: hypothetical protein WCT53_03230 [Candidatus Gracilibacteria bacterium]